MADIKGERVERFKLTSEQKKFQGEFAKVRRMGKALEMITKLHQMRGIGIKQLWDQMNRRVKMLQLGEPENKVRDLPGMDFGEMSKERTEGVPSNWSVNY